MGEFERIAEIKRRLLLFEGGTAPALRGGASSGTAPALRGGAESSSDVVLGIGDDAAVLAPSAHAQVWSVDAQVEGVHFRRDLLALPDIGYRAFVAALSDLGAMGARPRAALCSLIVPKALSDAELYAIVDGIAEAQRDYACAVAGGNLAAGAQLSLTTSVLGETSGPLLTRQGARAGDALYVTGELGGAALGLQLLQNGMAERGPRSVARWRRPAARIDEGLSIANDASAAIDVSDGLLQDLAHLAGDAQLGFEVELARLPVHPELLALAPALGLHAATYACSSGEEYELLFTARPDRVLRPATRIGRVVSAPGIRLLDAAGHEVALPLDRGFDHFRS